MNLQKHIEKVRKDYEEGLASNKTMLKKHYEMREAEYKKIGTSKDDINKRQSEHESHIDRMEKENEIAINKMVKEIEAIML